MLGNIISLLTLKISEFKVKINNFNADFLNDRKISITFSVYTSHLRQLGVIVRALQTIVEVISVKIYFKGY